MGSGLDIASPKRFTHLVFIGKTITVERLFDRYLNVPMQDCGVEQFPVAHGYDVTPLLGMVDLQKH
jgi:hypothetical protein